MPFLRFKTVSKAHMFPISVTARLPRPDGHSSPQDEHPGRPTAPPALSAAASAAVSLPSLPSPLLSFSLFEEQRGRASERKEEEEGRMEGNNLNMLPHSPNGPNRPKPGARNSTQARGQVTGPSSTKFPGASVGNWFGSYFS